MREKSVLEQRIPSLSERTVQVKEEEDVNSRLAYSHCKPVITVMCSHTRESKMLEIRKLLERNGMQSDRSRLTINSAAALMMSHTTEGCHGMQSDRTCAGFIVRQPCDRLLSLILKQTRQAPSSNKHCRHTAVTATAHPYNSVK